MKEAYLSAEQELARLAALAANRALNEGREQDFRENFRAFVLHRFLLWDVPTVEGEALLPLAQQSIQRVLELTNGDLHAAEVVMSCGGATTPAYKKVSLLFAIQKDFSIQFDAKRTAELTTISELAQEIIRLKRCGVETAAVDKPVSDDERALRVRSEFPFFNREHPPVYLDNAATMHMPKPVLRTLERLYASTYANVHRGVYESASQATAQYEQARGRVASFIGADPEEIVFTSGATAGLNLVAGACRTRISSSDRIVVTQMEHHSNYLPWLELCRETGAALREVPLTHSGEVDLSTLEDLLRPPTALLAVSHCSNVLGTINPLEKICSEAKAHGVLTVVDGAQGIRHEQVDVHRLGCDFYVFSGHKLMAGSGIGVLYGRSPLLDVMSSPVVGGGMLEDLRETDLCRAAAPHGWEAGTPNLGGALSLSAAIEFGTQVGWAWMQKREETLLELVREGLSFCKGVSILGSPKRRAGCVSFTVSGLSPQDVAASLNLQRISVRAGHHSAIPLHRAMKLTGSVRVSPAFYNTEEEIQQFLQAVQNLPL